MDYKQILEICEKASPEPWVGKFPHEGQRGIRIGTKVGITDIAIEVSRKADAEFIIFARTALPELAKRCMKLEKVAEAAQEFIKHFEDQGQSFKHTIKGFVDSFDVNIALHQSNIDDADIYISDEADADLDKLIDVLAELKDGE